MRRTILIVLGLLVALLPYLGLPYVIFTPISTFAGLVIVSLLLLPRKGKARRFREGDEYEEYGAALRDEPRALHVERKEVEDRPEVHIERETVIDTKRTHESPDTDVLVEKQVTTMRRRKQKSPNSSRSSSIESFLEGNT